MSYRVLHLVAGLNAGGTERQLLYLAQALAGRGMEFAVAVLFQRGGQLRGEMEQAGCRVWDVGCRYPLLHPANIGPLRRLRETVARERFDCVHAWLYHPNLVATWLGRAAGVRAVIVSERNVGYFHTAKHRWVARWRYRRADRVLANTAPILEMLRRQRMAQPEQLLLIPNGVPFPDPLPSPSARAAARHRGGFTESDFVVGCVGRLMAVKGHRFLVEAIGRLAATEPRVRLALVGDGPERPALERLASELGIQDRVRFFGHQADPTVWLPGWDVFALPSLSEGMSNALMEAMAYARPIVATDVGGNPTLIQHEVTGLLAPPADAPALAAAIGRLARDPARAETLGQRARAAIEPFSVARMADRVRTLYEELLGAR